MKMKKFTRNVIEKILSTCLLTTGFLYFDKISLLFFGEPEYPEES